MFFNLFKSKKSKKSTPVEDSESFEKESLNKIEREVRKQPEVSRTPAMSIPLRKQRQPPQMSRLGRYSSHNSSIGHLSVNSNATHASGISTTSSNKTTRSTKSNWSYNIDRFKGGKQTNPKMKSTGHTDLWAQAYAFGGR